MFPTGLGYGYNQGYEGFRSHSLLHFTERSGNSPLGVVDDEPDLLVGRAVLSDWPWVGSLEGQLEVLLEGQLDVLLEGQLEVLLEGQLEVLLEGQLEVLLEGQLEVPLEGLWEWLLEVPWELL